jgi:hypothetical protein
MNRGRVGEEREGKETDGCPLTRIVRLPLQLWGLGYSTGTGTGLNNCTFGYTAPVFLVSQIVTGMT